MDFSFEERPEFKTGGSKMNQERNIQTNLIDTTDCLEAVSVLRGWKNFLFAITILCLLLSQSAFWLVTTGAVKANGAVDEPVIIADEKTEQAAKQSAEEPNQSMLLSSAQDKHRLSLPKEIEFEQLAWMIKFLNFILILAAILYCLAILFILKISIVGRLGGIKHICRALFLSLVFIVLLVPWQKIFGGVVAGAIFTPTELLDSCQAIKQGGVFDQILHYLRFSAYWLIVTVLVILAQIRSGRWTRATLRRLEVI
jgi:hypothetical protein